MDSGLVVYGIEDTMKSVINGLVETIICFEGLTHHRATMKNKETEALSYKYIRESELSDPKHLVDF